MKNLTQFFQRLSLLPSDYPYLYTKDEATKIYLGRNITGG